MPAALILSLAQLGDRAILRVLLRALALTLLIFAGVAWGIFTLVAGIETTGWPDWARSLWVEGGGLPADGHAAVAQLHRHRYRSHGAVAG